MASTKEQPSRRHDEKHWPKPGALILDKKSSRTYTCGGLLGEGGFARCYEVTDSTEQRFAAKVIRKSSLTNQKQKHKLFAEIKIHQMMSHPSIVKFYTVFEDDLNVYMLLELCENKTLVEMLKARRRLREEEVRFFMWHLLDAVRYMHDNRVIHRDLKLGNLFLTSHSRLKVGDFGLAAILRHDGERKNTICGTPNYIAPEVLFDKNGHSYEVDMWSLGVIMYTLLIGRPPFQTDDVKAIYRNIRNNKYDFPSKIDISSEARDVINSLLTSQPENRPSVAEVLAHPFFSKFRIPETLSDSFLARSSVHTDAMLPDRNLANDINLNNNCGESKMLKEVTNQRNLPVFITKWIDYSNKYGLGYQLHDGTVGVYFNDSSSILMSSEKRSLEYLSYEICANGPRIRKRTFPLETPPKELEKKVILLRHFGGYMQQNLFKQAEVTAL
ncbi:Cell cycle serine/threonine-protein kinase cdc5/MSD2 [Phlyctochytrium planicorne]|nr:Cell cycle serine/threonine-protein kinase cdc5/MSD2 [Phlyctochytrium planicorne]